MPIRDWGKPGNIHDLQLQWHVPNAEEVACAQRLLDRFLAHELDSLSAFSLGDKTLTKEELKNRLSIVSNFLYGCGGVIPFLPSDPETNPKIVDSLGSK